MRRYIHFHQQAFINANVIFIVRNLHNHEHLLALKRQTFALSANHKQKTFTSFTCKIITIKAIVLASARIDNHLKST